MLKCHVRELLNVQKCILIDALRTFPTLGVEFERDLKRLHILSSARGSHLHCVDLPAAAKHLDRCLAQGQYVRSGLATTSSPSGRVVAPKLFRGLYLLVFEEGGALKENYDVEAIAFLRQLLAVGKKAKLQCSFGAVEDAVVDFVIHDSLLPEPEKVWEESGLLHEDLANNYKGFSLSPLYRSKVVDLCAKSAGLRLLQVMDTVSRHLTTALGDYNPLEWKCKHGPGAISQKSGKGIDKYNWYSWPERLERDFPIAEFGYYNHASWARIASTLELGSEEPNSRLVDVPKTLTKPRLIAAEPSEHQWCQQNLWHYFRIRTRNSWIGEFIKFDDASLNQRLCLEGSRDGELVTVDLSAASDSVTPHFVGQLFRCNTRLLSALQASRTLYCRQGLTDKVPTVIKLRKFSTMGSACTFPVESLGFLSICLSAALISADLKPTVRNIRSLIGKVAVFGDDLIVPRTCWEILAFALESFGFKINIDKTFHEGFFRESCGVDSYRGANVTPAYWNSKCGSTPESISGTLETANNFYLKFLVETSNYLRSTLPGKCEFPLVAVDSGISGHKSFVVPRDYARQRFSKTYQTMEVRIPTFSSRQNSRERTDDSALFQFFTEDPDPVSNWSAGVAQNTVLLIKNRWVQRELLEGQSKPA